MGFSTLVFSSVEYEMVMVPLTLTRSLSELALVDLIISFKSRRLKLLVEDFIHPLLGCRNVFIEIFLTDSSNTILDKAAQRWYMFAQWR